MSRNEDITNLMIERMESLFASESIDVNDVEACLKSLEETVAPTKLKNIYLTRMVKNKIIKSQI